MHEVGPSPRSPGILACDGTQAQRLVGQAAAWRMSGIQGSLDIQPLLTWGAEMAAVGELTFNLANVVNRVGQLARIDDGQVKPFALPAVRRSSWMIVMAPVQAAEAGWWTLRGPSHERPQ